MSRILVVDDSPDITRSLAMLLRQSGNEVQTAHGVAEALKALATFDADLIISDVDMGRKNDGPTLAKLVASQYPNNPIVLHTGGDEQAVAREHNVVCFAKDIKNLPKMLQYCRVS